MSKDPQTQIQVASIIAIRDTVEVEVGRIDQVPPYSSDPLFLCDGIVYDSIHTYHRIYFLVDIDWYWDFKGRKLPGQQNNTVLIEKWRIVDV